MQLYGDIFFFYNLIMDYIVLKITAVIWRGKKISHPFLWAAFTNILYIAAVFVFGLYAAMPYIFLGIAVAGALRPDGPLCFLGMIFTAYLTTFVLGSLALGMIAVFNLNGSVMLIIAVLCLIMLQKISDNSAIYNFSGLFPLEIRLGEQSLDFTALLDSGNSLKINGKPVIICDPDAAAPLLPYASDIFETECATVTGRTKLFCFYADAKINKYTINDICIAVSNVPITGNFNALISADIFNKSEKETDRC